MPRERWDRDLRPEGMRAANRREQDEFFCRQGTAKACVYLQIAEIRKTNAALDEALSRYEDFMRNHPNVFFAAGHEECVPEVYGGPNPVLYLG